MPDKFSVVCTAVTDESGSDSAEIVDKGIDEDNGTSSLTAAVMLVEVLISVSTLELRVATGRSVGVEAEYSVSEGKLMTVEASSRLREEMSVLIPPT